MKEIELFQLSQIDVWGFLRAILNSFFYYWALESGKLLSFYLSIYLSIYPSTYPSIH